MVTLCKERAEHNISKAQGEDTILKNIPVLVKDVTDVKELNTFGSKYYENNISERSDILVTNIEKNGGIILGKTNTPELAAGSNTFNEVFGTTKILGTYHYLQEEVLVDPRRLSLWYGMVCNRN